MLDGVVIPWIANSPRPFELVIGELTRRRAEHDKGTLHNEMFKQLGNSLYGKLGQGIKGTTVYNTRSDRREVIGPCSITNPYLAAHVTGLIRALVSELIASIPDRWNVVSVTTDGFITNAPMMDIAMTGPVASHMLLVRMGLVRSETASAELIEEKFAVAQVLPWRTRGIATLRKATEEPGGKSKLARGGMREPHGTSDPNAWFVWVALNREPGTKYRVSEPLAFPVAHRKAADHRFQVREKTFNFEYDMKRRPVDPVPQYVTVPGPGWAAGLEPDVYIAQHLAFNTIPWATVAEFTEVRDQFEQWRLKHQGQLRTIADWRRWEDFRAGAGASRHGVRRGRGGVVGQVVRIFQCAYVHRVWGMHGGDYKRAAEALTKAGYPTTEQSFKNALRNKAAPEHAIPADAPGIRELIQVLVSIWPEFQWRRMVKGAGPGYLRQNTPEPHLERARERQKT